MSNYIIIISIALLVTKSFSQVGIGTTNPSQASMLEISSQTNGMGNYKGFMPPRVPNEAAREAINPNSTDYGLLVFVESIGCLQIWENNEWDDVYCRPPTSEPWINEIHYNNIGADIGEFVEIAGRAGRDLSNYNIELYNGDTKKRYKTVALRGIIPRQSNNYGTIRFLMNPIQNGGVNGDGIALVKGSQVILFISYDHSFTPIDGTAIGITSINIGVFEDDFTPVGHSLQLTGNGNRYSDFEWQMPKPDSPGNLNDGQNIIRP